MVSRSTDPSGLVSQREGGEAIFDPSTRKGLRASVRENPFKCIDNEKSVTGMSVDIGPVITSARDLVKLLLIFPPRPRT